jgi:hypothetical protein
MLIGIHDPRGGRSLGPYLTVFCDCFAIEKLPDKKNDDLHKKSLNPTHKEDRCATPGKRFLSFFQDSGWS